MRSQFSVVKPLKYIFFCSLFLFSYSSFGNDCFLNSANSGNLVTGIRSCAAEITAGNPLLAGENGSSRGLVRLHGENPNDPEFASLSAAASKVYYSEDPKHCGPGTKNQLPCRDLGRLVMLHDSGRFENQPSCKGTNCAVIAKWLNSHHDRGGTDCNGTTGILKVHYCTAIVKSFLANPKCANGSSESACQAELKARFEANEQKCSWANFRDSGNGASVGSCGSPEDVTTASITPEPETTDPQGPVTEDTNPINEAPTTSETEELTQKMDDAARQVFGGGGPANLEATAERGALNVPGTDVEGPKGGDVSEAAAAGLNGLDPGANSSLPATALLSGRQEGIPGGSEKPPGPQNAGAGGRGGPIAGGQGFGGQGGGAAGGKKKGRGRRASRFKNVSEDMGKFTTAQGQGAGQSGSPNVQASEMDKKVRAQLARNQAGNQLDRDKLNRAFQKNLGKGQGIDRNLMIKASYFPNHTEVYFWLNQTSDTLDEQGI